MAGIGPPPQESRRRANEPSRGDWKTLSGVGWQHGEIPKPPTGLLKASRQAWDTWFNAWFAAYWDPHDLPVLRQLIALFDIVERGQAKDSTRSELRQMLNGYGVSKEGQIKLRWKAPPTADPAADEPPVDDADGAYGHLRAIEGGR